MKPGKHFNPYEPHEVLKSQAAVGDAFNRAGMEALNALAEIEHDLTDAEVDRVAEITANRSAGVEIKRQLARLRRTGTRSEKASRQATMAAAMNAVIKPQEVQS